MCGRLTLKTHPSEWSQLLLPAIDFQQLVSEWQPRYNIAPTQNILVIANDSERTTGNELHFDYFRWGLVPSWATELSIGSRMINARRETLKEKKSFVGPLRKRRCLIVVDGYYEWQVQDAKTKQPYWISPSRSGVMQLAGLWEINSRAEGVPIATCTIITTAANAALTLIHDRMPVILDGPAAARWVDTECDADEAFDLLGPAEDAFLNPRKVSPYVNNARHEDEKCLA